VSAERNRLALELFAPLGPTYDRYARLLSLGQDARWRRFLVSRIDAGTGDTILDVATGTGAVAIDAKFAGLTFTYLLRYVQDPAATMRELARVVRPGGALAGLEFGVPRGPARPLWNLYVHAGLPLAGRLISPGWRRVGDFLGRSIGAFAAEWPPERVAASWEEAGIGSVRFRRLSLGGGVVTWGRRR
jgi:demethylmenaquinone methyltransferase/2-methoxy-6-polyprenyl-1,4-benzoquinol methylase